MTNLKLCIDFKEQPTAKMAVLRARTGLDNLAIIQRAIAIFDIVTEHAAVGGSLVLDHPTMSPERLNLSDLGIGPTPLGEQG